MTAGERLKIWRGKRPLREIAELLECDASYVAYLEKNERVPTLKVALLAQKLAGIEPNEWARAQAQKPSAEPSGPSSSESGEHPAADPDAEPDVDADTTPAPPRTDAKQSAPPSAGAA